MNQLAWGLQISALGMGLVFGLLALLWGLLSLVLRLDSPPNPALGESAAGADSSAESSAAAATAHGPVAGAPSPATDAALAAAITVAVLAHAAFRRGEAAPAMRAHSPGSLLHASRWVASGRMRQNHTWQRGR